MSIHRGDILMLQGEFPKFIYLHYKGFKQVSKVLVLIQRINDLKRLGSGNFHPETKV